MAASQAASLSSKLSTSLRRLLLHQSAARSTTMATSAAFSLTGKPLTNYSPTIMIPSHDKQKLIENSPDLRYLGRVDWPAFNHQQVVETAARGGRKADVDDDDDDESKGFDDSDSYDISDSDAFDDDSDAFDDDD